MTAAASTISGVPERRVIVTRHAVERARNRYGQPHLTPTDIRADVEDAVASGREGIRLPREIHRGAESLKGRREKVRYVWTGDFKRCYTVKRVRDERNGHTPALIVLTAMPGAP